MQLRLSGEFKRFADEELRAVLTLLAGRGVVREQAFGSWVLLQPERINAYAQTVMRRLQADEQERGCQARRAEENGPAFQRWVSGREGNESRQGRKNTFGSPPFLPPLPGLGFSGHRYPQLKRRAIVGRHFRGSHFRVFARLR